MFFNKEVSCEKCGVVLPKKSMGVLDTIRQTRLGKRKDGKRIYLCNNCMKESLWDLLSNYNHKAVIIYPSTKHNAYVYYTFNELEEGLENIRRGSYAKEEDLINDMKKLLPPEKEKCDFCDNLAVFTWTSLDVFHKRNPFNWSVNREIEDYKFLCNKCLVKAIKEKVEQNNIHIEAVLPPFDEGEGFFTPWEN